MAAIFATRQRRQLPFIGGIDIRHFITKPPRPVRAAARSLPPPAPRAWGPKGLRRVSNRIGLGLLSPHPPPPPHTPSREWRAVINPLEPRKTPSAASGPRVGCWAAEAPQTGARAAQGQVDAGAAGPPPVGASRVRGWRPSGAEVPSGTPLLVRRSLLLSRSSWPPSCRGHAGLEFSSHSP
ncbi:unnamed protein product [Rangifer tarandus platyrhynchus]|uniref:Uncharacterized protein n=1 Tax=Rangifer tarandus platyrhynchus TaxID=3082113 RepID=A0ABN8Y246_RANTA|nr:unnamed protein product [Rangifer tarandus platyrhynchus]